MIVSIAGIFLLAMFGLAFLFYVAIEYNDWITWCFDRLGRKKEEQERTTPRAFWPYLSLYRVVDHPTDAELVSAFLDDLEHGVQHKNGYGVHRLSVDK